ncbi:hypothetical protein [Mesorhizobium sp. RIZ17]|uniref:hypothetical protein n=1 Tax=Mesorhizobium sp. RIZ17 TaxID=3132743 RepID=UPI003DA95501
MICLAFAFRLSSCCGISCSLMFSPPTSAQTHLMAIPLAVLVGAQMYLHGLAALLLVRGLLELGMSPGAAMALLVLGGAVRIWGVMDVALVLRPATIALFMALAVSGSLVIGYVFQALWTLRPGSAAKQLDRRRNQRRRDQA